MHARPFSVFCLVFSSVSALGSVAISVDVLSSGEGQLPPSTSILCIDVMVDVTNADVWTAGGLRAETLEGVTILYDHDPYSGDVRLTNPGADHRFVTFYSKPRGRDAFERFTNGGAVSAGSYCPAAPNPPTAEDTLINVVWFANPPETPESPTVDGAVFRLSLDVSATGVPAQFFQVFTGNTAPPGTTVAFRSTCSGSYLGLSCTTYDVPSLTGINWGVAFTDPPIMACCLPSGTCQNLTASDCTSAGGTPDPAGLTCAE